MNWLALASLVIGSLLVPLALVTKILADMYRHNRDMFDLMSERITYSRESDIKGALFAYVQSVLLCHSGSPIHRLCHRTPRKYDNNLLITALDLSQYDVKAGIRSVMVGAAIYYLFVVSVGVIVSIALYRMIPQPEE